MIDIADPLIPALSELYRYGNKEPLINLIEEGRGEILQNQSVREILIKALRGEPLKIGTKKTSHKMEEWRELILASIATLEGIGMPVKNSGTSGKPCACRTIADLTAKNESTIYQIFKNDGNYGRRLTYHLQKKTGETLLEIGDLDYLMEYLSPLAAHEKWKESFTADVVQFFPKK